MPELAARCARCRRRHLAHLPCWSGHYAQRITAHILATQGRVCWMDGEPATSADHVTPRSHGGDDSDANLRPACGRCNSRRGNKANPFDTNGPPSYRPSGAPLSDRWRPA